MASAVAALWLVVRDVGSMSFGAAALLVGTVSGLALAVSGVHGLVARYVRERGRVIWMSLFAGLPAVYGLWLWTSSDGPVPWWVPAAIVATGALIWGGSHRLQRLPVHPAPVVFLLAMLAFVHVGSDTLSAVRAGTWHLHTLLYLGTWSASACLIPSLSHALQMRAEGRASPMWIAAATLAAGIALVEVDRCALVGLYPAVHVWLLVLGFVAIEAGASLWLAAREWVLQGRIAGAVLVGCVGLGTFHVAALENPEQRAELFETEVGHHIVRYSPVKAACCAAGPAGVLLEVDQRLDAPALKQPYNVLLVTVDALRFDAIRHAPSLQKFGDQSVSFTRAYAQGTRTAIGMGSLMWGRYSAHIQWDLWAYIEGRILPTQELTLAQRKQFGDRLVHTTIPRLPAAGTLPQRLQRAGLHTMATAYAGQNHFFKKGLGFDAGFDQFDDLTAVKWDTPTSNNVLQRAFAQLDKARQERFFQWIHFYDPHEANGSRDRYDQLVGDFDRAFGALIDGLKQRKLFDHTVIVVTSDHGEAFGEHRHIGHGTSLYEEQIHVPLMIRVPGMPPRQIKDPVGLVDVAATLCVMTGASTTALDGINLVPLMRGEAYPTGRPVFVELHRYLSSDGAKTHDLKAVVVGTHKLIVNRLYDTAHLFDVAADPNETSNLVSHQPEIYAQLMGLIDALAAQEAQPSGLPK